MGPRALSLLIFFVVALSLPAEGVLRVVGDRNFPPFMFLDERGEPSGMDAAVARLVGERMGEEVSIDLLPWAEAVLALERGSADILAAMRVTPEREGRYRFTRPHCVNKLTAFT
ncbi:MAG TPA: transporter substrate-binding domain-containing protein, partial [Synergistaceae bacterium]|nr:transporter substrate-binding domain-containing protein [Synergistaceae bacterium]